MSAAAAAAAATSTHTPTTPQATTPQAALAARIKCNNGLLPRITGQAAADAARAWPPLGPADVTVGVGVGGDGHVAAYLGAASRWCDV